MHTETLSIGSELLAGSWLDTNGAYLADRLARLGLAVARHTVLPDDLEPLVEHLADVRRRASRPAFVLVTGGIGPTLDDVTRQAVAAAMDAPLTENAECRTTIEEMFRHRGRPMSPSNLRQAMIPAGATVLPNSCGTAPGFHLERDGVHVFTMPGVPAEMKVMFADCVESVLRRLAPAGTAVCERVLHTFGAGESAVGERIAELMAAERNPRVGTLAADGMISIRLTATAADEDQGRQMLDRDEAAVRRELDELVVGRDDERLPQVIAALLAGRGATLAVAESCTGGLIAEMITDVPGASAFFIEGLVTYANKSKTLRLGVPEELIRTHGAASNAVARAMAEGACASARATYALATTGIAGPTGGSADKPVGLVFIALAGPEGTASQRMLFPGDRERVRRRAALTALNLLRLRLLGRGSTS